MGMPWIWEIWEIWEIWALVPRIAVPKKTKVSSENISKTAPKQTVWMTAGLPLYHEGESSFFDSRWNLQLWANKYNITAHQGMENCERNIFVWSHREGSVNGTFKNAGFRLHVKRCKLIPKYSNSSSRKVGAVI